MTKVADRRRKGIAALWSEDGASWCLGDDGRIRLDYQFLDWPPSS
jgi:hypothetical protein